MSFSSGSDEKRSPWRTSTRSSSPCRATFFRASPTHASVRSLAQTRISGRACASEQARLPAPQHMSITRIGARRLDGLEKVERGARQKLRLPPRNEYLVAGFEGEAHPGDNLARLDDRVRVHESLRVRDCDADVGRFRAMFRIAPGTRLSILQTRKPSVDGAEPVDRDTTPIIRAPMRSDTIVRMLLCIHCKRCSIHAA